MVPLDILSLCGFAAVAPAVEAEAAAISAVATIMLKGPAQPIEDIDAAAADAAAAFNNRFIFRFSDTQRDYMYVGKLETEV